MAEIEPHGYPGARAKQEQKRQLYCIVPCWKSVTSSCRMTGGILKITSEGKSKYNITLEIQTGKTAPRSRQSLNLFFYREQDRERNSSLSCLPHCIHSSMVMILWCLYC